ncbi:hydrogenase maturation nickel metallochaperone HypA [Candidatus Hecatella orcuttiae]|jgi:hydrogenase nickel incorporation protein HypA/HybF|uniref:hydrogenase maturation nickel metallochaperone HypA n=1 Tax=Candidatus Hecatella orcuttiae TaxID=1935119 RepID=UPI00286821A5|nr:hydrogenase maturation nickel metallochaperone HypA [Candidatus Hecatella orcuttiae]
MHEYSFTAQIVEKILDEASKRRAKKILAVRLTIGKLTFLSVEQVKFCYQALVKGTPLEGSTLHVQEKEGVVKCELCGYRGPISYEENPAYHFRLPVFRCPKCGNDIQVVEGKECIIKSVKMEV